MALFEVTRDRVFLNADFEIGDRLEPAGTSLAAVTLREASGCVYATQCDLPNECRDSRPQILVPSRDEMQRLAGQGDTDETIPATVPKTWG